MIELRVNNKKYSYFETVDVSLKLDSVASTFNLTGYFDTNDPEKRKLIKPLSYQDCEIWIIDNRFNINEKLITGTILNVGIQTSKNITSTTVSGYSKTGILEDVNIPISIYPIQYDNSNLIQITKKITDYFGLRLKVFDNAFSDALKPFKKSSIEPSMTIKEYLTSLCKQRNITLAHDNEGRLLLYKIEAKISSKVSISENDINVMSISISPNAQGIHSECTVFRQATKESNNTGETTINSPFVSQNRPIVMVLTDGDINDTSKYANRILSSEAKNFPVTIVLQDWLIKGKIVRSGFYIEVDAPSIFIQKTKMIVESVDFTQDKSKKTMTITAVLPCVYTGILPSKSPFV